MASVNKITTADVNAAEDLIRQVLRDRYPDTDVELGSALSELVVQTLAYGLAYIASERTELEERTNLSSLASLTDSNAIAAADAIISNYLISRNNGGFSNGVITIYLSSPVDVLIRRTTKFYKNASAAFSISTGLDTVIPSANLRTIRDDNGNPIEYAFDLAVTCDTVGSVGDIAAGSWASWTNFNAYVTRIQNVESFDNGVEVETNAELVERARTAVTVRNLINERSANTVLRDNFSQVSKVATFGAGHQAMQRDLVTVESAGLELHVLGHMDHWLWLPLAQSQTTSGVVASSIISLTALDTPILRLTRAYYISSGDEIDLTYTNEDSPASGEYRLKYADPHKALSLDQNVYVEFNSDLEGVTVYIVYDTVTGMREVHDYVSSRVNRVACANPLCKAALPVFVNMNLQYTVRADAAATANNTLIAEDIASYINGLNGAALYASGVVERVLSTWGHIISSVSLPLDINYTLWSTQGLKVEYTSPNQALLDSTFLTNFETDPYPTPGDFSMDDECMRFIAVASNISVSLG